MKKINVFCVLVLALMLIDLVVDLFFATSDRTVVLNLENESLGSLLFILFVALLALGAIVVAIFSFVKFILNVNRNEVFTERNIKQIRKYGYSALVCGVCMRRRLLECRVRWCRCTGRRLLRTAYGRDLLHRQIPIKRLQVFDLYRRFFYN